MSERQMYSEQRTIPSPTEYRLVLTRHGQDVCRCFDDKITAKTTFDAYLVYLNMLRVNALGPYGDRYQEAYKQAMDIVHELETCIIQKGHMSREEVIERERMNENVMFNLQHSAHEHGAKWPKHY